MEKLRRTACARLCYGRPALALRRQSMATTLASLEAREVLRCEHCQLVQFRTSTGQCRRCHKGLEPVEPPQSSIHLHTGAPATEEIDIAKTVRGLRRERNLSQRQLATRMQVPRTYISKIENGKAVPTLSSLDRLARALEAPLSRLLEDGQSRRAQEVAAIFADPFLRELLPLLGYTNAFQRQVLLSHTRELARETPAVPTRPQLLRA